MSDPKTAMQLVKEWRERIAEIEAAGYTAEDMRPKRGASN